MTPNDEMQRTKHGSSGASPLISVFGGPKGDAPDDMMRLTTAAALVVGMASVACDGGTSVEGMVHDERGVPLRGAEVTMTYAGHNTPPVETDLKGGFHIGIMHAPGGWIVSRLSAKMQGHRAAEIEFRGSGRFRCDITLRAAENARAEVTPVHWDKLCGRRD